MDDADTMRCTAGREITHPHPPIQDTQDSWKSVNHGEMNVGQLGELEENLESLHDLTLFCEYGETIHKPGEGRHTSENRWKVVTE